MASLAGGVVCWIRSIAVAIYSSLPKNMSGAGGGLMHWSTLLKQPISVNNSEIKYGRDILQVVKLDTMTIACLRSEMEHFFFWNPRNLPG